MLLSCTAAVAAAGIPFVYSSLPHDEVFAPLCHHTGCGDNVQQEHSATAHSVIVNNKTIQLCSVVKRIHAMCICVVASNDI